MLQALLYPILISQKGSLGRPRIEEPARTDRCPIWYATPGRVPRLGPRHACKAVWVSASGDQTFVQVSQALIKTDTLFSSTITANNNTIGMLSIHFLLNINVLFFYAIDLVLLFKRSIFDAFFSIKLTETILGFSQRRHL